jgi:glycolate oxidase FAD binding subunit
MSGAKGGDVSGTSPIALEIAERVRAAHDRGGPLRVRGAGSWLDAGHPVSGATALSLADLHGVVRYTPDDLTMTVEAGTSLAELDEVTRPHGQWCPLLPWGNDRGTVGATIATGTTGPFAASLGRARDLVLGMDAVDGTGRVIAAGGRVVKNVAGFDLTRAFTGSWGTLAVITRVHLRLRARPAVDETWAIAGEATTDATVPAFARGAFAPLGCERLTAGEAHALGVGHAGWLVRIGGNASFVTAARAALRALGATTPHESSVWDRLRALRDPEAPARRWKWDPLSRRLKATFDPRRVLNPGLLGDAA